MAAGDHDAGAALLHGEISQGRCWHLAQIIHHQPGVHDRPGHRPHDAALRTVGAWAKIRGQTDRLARRHVVDLAQKIQKTARIDIGLQICDVGHQTSEAAGAEGQGRRFPAAKQKRFLCRVEFRTDSRGQRDRRLENSRRTAGAQLVGSAVRHQKRLSALEHSGLPLSPDGDRFFLWSRQHNENLDGMFRAANIWTMLIQLDAAEFEFRGRGRINPFLCFRQATRVNDFGLGALEHYIAQEFGHVDMFGSQTAAKDIVRIGHQFRSCAV